ncbi:hypothetical protein ANAPC1_01229 [Anaplasma phagocytophilum]|uniref:Uncharacterized protein n=1 Tax=Anaplasma phagocytophilum TaxID=948 RepID=A0AA45UTR7_ANAPH|nr:hypothetical protein [Anaplasma phagocytophilum]SBO14857.1 hypothetical protein ANAPC1_01229 [Anaplasma phagocytophilum]
MLLEDANGNWPTSTVKHGGTGKPASTTNAKAVATDLTQKLIPEEKTMNGLLILVVYKNLYSMETISRSPRFLLRDLVNSTYTHAHMSHKKIS